MPKASRYGGASVGGQFLVDQKVLPNTDFQLAGTQSDLQVDGNVNVGGNLTLSGSGLDRRIGIAHIASNFTTASTSYVDVTGATLSITIPTPANFELVAWLPLLIEEAIGGQTAVTSGSRTSGVVTMNSTAHGLKRDQLAQVTVADTTYNGIYVVQSVPTANQFLYNQTGLGDDAASGTGVVGVAGNPGAGADLRLVRGSNVVVTADSTPRATVGNQVMSFYLRAPIPAPIYTPTAGTTETFKLQVKSTHATSDVSVFVDFAGLNNVAYLEALRA